MLITISPELSAVPQHIADVNKSLKNEHMSFHCYIFGM